MPNQKPSQPEHATKITSRESEPPIKSTSPKTGDTEKDYFKQWLTAVKNHPQFSKELRECIEWFMKTPNAQSDLVARCLARRYRNMWDVPKHLSMGTVLKCLDEAIFDCLGKAISDDKVPVEAFIKRLRRQYKRHRRNRFFIEVHGFGYENDPVDGMVYGNALEYSTQKDEEGQYVSYWDYTAPVQYDDDEHSAVTIHLYDGATLKEAKEAFEKAWSEAKLGTRVAPRLGVMPGHGRKDIEKHLEYYEKWYKWTQVQKRTDSFIEAVERYNSDALITAWQDEVPSRKSIEVFDKNVRNWLEPTTDIPCIQRLQASLSSTTPKTLQINSLTEPNDCPF